MNKKQPFLSLPSDQDIENKFKRLIAFNYSTFHILIGTYPLPKISILRSKLSSHIHCNWNLQR